MAYREFIDWRPFTYFTSRMRTTAIGVPVMARSVIETVEFVSLGEHSTRIVFRWRVTNQSRISILALRATRPFYVAFWRRRAAALVSIAEEDAAVNPLVLAHD